MKTLTFLALLLTQAALADTFNYQLYQDPEFEDALDIKVQVVLSGKFNKESKVQELRVWGEKNKKPILLFKVPANLIKAKWKSGNVLNVSTAFVKPVIKKQYIPVHSDTFIPAEDDYDITFEINERGMTKAEVDFFVANQSQEEMALQGYLRKI